MIIVNQNGHLFRTVKEIKEIKVFYDYSDYVLNFKTKESHGVDPYWFFKINNTIFAKYESEIEKDYVLRKVKEALKIKREYFEFPKQLNIDELLEAI